jgi:tetratricopeptide (TPR) repeat protein
VTAQKTTPKMSEYEKALAEFTKAVKAFNKKDDEKSKEALTDFIQNFSEEKELVDRANIYLKIVESRLDPPKKSLKTAEDFYVEGVFQMNQGSLDSALKSFEMAHSKEPKQGKFLYALADAYCLKKEHDDALKYLKQAVKLDSQFGTLAQNEVDFDPIKKEKRFFEIVNSE